MNDTYSLLVWELIPEETYFYLIPNEEISLEQRALLHKAHNHFVNFDNASDVDVALNFLNCVLAPEDSKDLDGDFPAGFPYEQRCMWAKYKVDMTVPVRAVITEVVLSGFIL